MTDPEKVRKLAATAMCCMLIIAFAAGCYMVLTADKPIDVANEWALGLAAMAGSSLAWLMGMIGPKEPEAK